MKEISQEEHRLLNTQRFLVSEEFMNPLTGQKIIQVQVFVEAIPRYEGEPVPEGAVAEIQPRGRPPVSVHPPRKEVPESSRSNPSPYDNRPKTALYEGRPEKERDNATQEQEDQADRS